MSEKPVILLAFANGLKAERYLRHLPEEQRRLREIVQKAVDRGLCKLEVRPDATLDEIVEVFNRHGRRVAIFHYGGHAGPDSLLLESSEGVAREAHAEGLARFLGLQGGLQLVFLNGCSTGPQVAGLLAAGVAAVVATARPIDDEVARAFAVVFYTQLTIGRTFRDAFTVAGALVKANHSNTPRDLIRVELPFSTEDITDDLGFPWKLYVRDGAAAVEQESLPKLADQPLLGLPPLPPATWLPPTPYRHLQQFTCAEAHVFFGRGQEIADLYGFVISPTERRVILYSGATGVGKSSVLYAGVLPRLAATHDVIYRRRDATAGLLGTLRAGLMPPGDGSALAPDLAGLWLARDTPERPLVVVLDQAEEAFTRPRAGILPADEVTELVQTLQALFHDPAHSPPGRLILGFRKEWLQEFERAHNDARLGYESLRLGPLDHKGIIEAISGPTLTDDLRRHYGLTIAPGLADRIAVELEHDAYSALAPTLQVLLTNMWKAAVWEAAGDKEVSFTEALYDRLKDKGYLLKDVLDEGLKTLKAWRPEVVDSGFALDLLEYHTTSFDTAETRTRAELLERYGHRADVLDECLRLCESSYLLIPAERRGDPLAALSPEANTPVREPAPTRLGHDTLAPLIRERFRASMAPGQHARRLLENRAPEWKVGATGSVLDRADLEAVEQGVPGMRALKKDESRLLAASHEAEKRRQAEVLTTDSEALFASRRELFDALIAGIRAGKLLTRTGVNNGTRMRLVATLHRALHFVKERNRLEGHTDRVAGVCFSPDGQTIATSSWDQTVKLWSRQGKELQTLAGHDDRVYSVCFSPDGELIATASMDQTVKLWSRQGKELQTLRGHREQVWSVCFSPDGQLIATASSDKTVKLWNRDGIELTTLGGFKAGVLSVCFSPDGQTIAAGSYDHTIKVWTREGEELKTLRGHNGHEHAVFSVCFSPNGQMLASASKDKTVRLWSWKDQDQEPKILRGHNHAVTCVCFSPDGQMIASGSCDDKIIKLWSQDGSKELHTLYGHRGRVNSVCFSPDGQLIASASYDGTVKLWSRESPYLKILTGHTNVVRSVHFSPDGQLIVTAGEDNRAKLWNRDGRELKTLCGHIDSIRSVCFSPDGRMIATGSDDSTAKLWSQDGQKLQTLKGGVGEVRGICFSPDGQMVATAGSQGIVKLWSRDGQERDTLRGHTNVVNSVCFSPDGQVIASASWDKTVKLWSRDGELRETLTGHGHRVNSVCFSPDGQLIATASHDTTVKLWSIKDSQGLRIQELRTLSGHDNIVNDICFSPDGQVIASASSDYKVKLWSADGQELQTLQGHTNDVNSVHFSPDSQTLATAGSDYNVILWNLYLKSLDNLLALACDWIQDYLQNNSKVSKDDRHLCNKSSGEAR